MLINIWVKHIAIKTKMYRIRIDFIKIVKILVKLNIIIEIARKNKLLTELSHVNNVILYLSAKTNCWNTIISWKHYNLSLE